MNGKILIKNRHASILLDISELFYVINDKRKVVIHTADSDYWQYASLDCIMEQGDERLYRCHHNLAVNLECIKMIDDHGVTLYDGELLTMCRAALQQTKKAWISHLLSASLKGRERIKEM